SRANAGCADRRSTPSRNWRSARFTASPPRRRPAIVTHRTNNRLILGPIPSGDHDGPLGHLVFADEEKFGQLFGRERRGEVHEAPKQKSGEPPDQYIRLLGISGCSPPAQTVRRVDRPQARNDKWPPHTDARMPRHIKFVYAENVRRPDPN